MYAVGAACHAHDDTGVDKALLVPVQARRAWCTRSARRAARTTTPDSINNFLCLFRPGGHGVRGRRGVPRAQRHRRPARPPLPAHQQAHLQPVIAGSTTRIWWLSRGPGLPARGLPASRRPWRPPRPPARGAQGTPIACSYEGQGPVHMVYRTCTIVLYPELLHQS